MYFGWDMDGVLVDSSPVFSAVIAEKFRTKNFKRYDDKGNERFKFEIDGVPDIDIWNAIHKCLFHYQEFMSPIAGAATVINQVAKAIDRVPVIISARPADVYDQTAEWIRKNLTSEFNLYLVEPPKNDDALKKKVKNELAKELSLTHFVEDRIKYARDLTTNCPNIEKVFLLNQPWNQGRRVGENVIRINSLYDILDYLH